MLCSAIINCVANRVLSPADSDPSFEAAAAAADVDNDACHIHISSKMKTTRLF